MTANVDDILKVVVIGSGPAGLTAALYLSRADLEPVVISGSDAGGQLMITTDVDNYPGFPEGVLGPELIKLMRDQAERFGTKFVEGDVTEVDFAKRPFTITTASAELKSGAVVIATGASARWLGLDSEMRLRGHGVSACATCDGFFFRDKEVMVVGGGDAAIEEATFLTKFASRVSVIHRRDQLRASKIMQQKAFDNPKIDFIWDSVLVDVLGDESVTGVKTKNVRTEEITEKSCNGVFVAIGHDPNTVVFKGHIELDEKGYIVTKNGTSTSIEGVFAAGDVVDYRYRQAITAAGMGCMAALDAEKYLEELNR